MTARIAVLGSVNLDIVATGATLPAPGETVTNAVLAQHPGGKGANQALAAARLGADVWLSARVGNDANADAALRLLREAEVDLSHIRADDTAATGVALIAVSASGENQIVVAPGANATLTPDHMRLPPADALILQLEIPLETVSAAARDFHGFLALNLAPAAPLPAATLARADLIVANEGEAAFYGEAIHAARGHVAITYGAKGAALFKQGKKIAEAAPPPITPVDTTGAGDTFVAALTLALLEGQSHEAALRFACAAGAVTATRAGAQTSLPSREEVEAILTP
ncbi:MAG: ribokinase [Micropepsaceae bacterium]